MKKRIGLFLVLMLALLALTACGCEHVDKNDDGFCDECEKEFEDGKDLPDPCAHRDAEDNGKCDKCGEAYTDGKDLPDEPTCEHRDADDNAKCDKCGETFEDGKDLPNGGETSEDENSGDSAHTHSFGSFIMIQDSTCTERGIKVRKCSCGAEEMEFVSKVHTNNGNGICSLCNRPLIPTKGISYKLSKDGTYALVDDYTGEDAVILLASEYEGRPVNGIDNYAFANNDEVVRVYIPDSVTYISNGAFFGCENLELVELSDNIEYIYDEAFDECPKLSFNEYANAQYLGSSSNPYLTLISCRESQEHFSVTVHSNAKIIAERVFYGNSYIEEIVIGNNVTHINSYAFYQCASLSKVDFGANLKEIGDGAFYNCPRLTAAILPEGLQTIGDYAFYWNYELANISIPSSIKEIGDEAFSENLREHYNSYGDALYLGNSENPFLILYAGLNDAISIAVHKDTVIVCKNAFEKINTLESVIIGDHVKIIDDDAFSGCKSLKSVSIADSVEYIGKNAFAGCTALKKVCLGKNVKTIAPYAFAWCSIETLIIPDSVTLIEKYAFFSCEKLFSVTLGKKIEKIEDGAFSNDIKLIEVINYSDLDIKISDSGFGGVAAYAKTVHRGERVIQEVNGFVFLFDEKDNYLVGYLGENAEISLPKDYNGESYLVLDSAFAKNKKITSVKIPRGVESIGSNSFCECINLKTVVIEEGLMSIGDRAFYGCDNIENLLLPTTLIHVGELAIPGTSSLKYSLYDNAHYLGNENNPYVLLVSADGKIASVTVHPNTKIIYHMAFSSQRSLESISLPEGLVEIGKNAFSHCESLDAIKIPNSVITIGEEAFLECSVLKTVDFGSGVETIGKKAFYDCYWLSNIKLPGILTTIENEAFGECHCIDSIVIPDSVTTLGIGVFYNCSRLSTVVIGDGVTYLNDTFYQCNVTNITFGKNIVSISQDAFYRWYNSGNKKINITDMDFWCNVQFCGESSNSLFDSGINYYYNGEPLEQLVFSNEVTHIAPYAFYNALNIKNVSFSDNTVYIGDFAFSNNNCLETVKLPNNLQFYGKGAFYYCDNLKMNELLGMRYLGSDENPYLLLMEVLDLDLSFYAINEHTKFVAGIAFSKCYGVEEIIIGNNISDFCVENIKYSESLKLNKYDNAYYIGNADNPFLLLVYADKDAVSCEIHGSTKIIGLQAFYGSNISSIVIPDSVETIQAGAFSYCLNLENVTIGNKVKTIGAYAFSHCSMLKSVVIPDSVTFINSGAFTACDTLKSIFLGSGVSLLQCDFSDAEMTYKGTYFEWVKIKKFGNAKLLKQISCDNGDFSGDYSIIMDFEKIWLPSSERDVVIIPLNGKGDIVLVDNLNGDILPWEKSGFYYEFSSSTGRCSTDSNGNILGEACGFSFLDVYYLSEGEKVYLLRGQQVFVAECDFSDSASCSRFSKVDKEYIRMCLDLAYALPKVSSPTLADLGLLDNFWNAVGDQTKNISEKLKPGKYDPEVAEIKRNLAVIIQNYVDENNLQEYILGNYKVTVETIEALISLKDEGREAEYNLLTEEQKNELDVLISAYNNAKDIEGYEKTLSSYNKLLKMLTGVKKTNDNLDKICKWETIETAQRAVLGLDLMKDMVDEGLFKNKFSKLTKVAGFTFDAFLYVMNDYSANIELLELLRDEFVKVDNVDPALKVAIDELIADYSNKSATAWENWLTDMGAAQLNGIGNFLIGKLVLPQFGIVKFVVESYAGSTFAAEKFELYTMAMMSSAIYDTLDPIMDMYLTGKQTMPIEKLKTFVSLYLYIVKAENDLVAYNFWSDYPFAEKIDCGNMSKFIQNTFGMYLK